MKILLATKNGKLGDIPEAEALAVLRRKYLEYFPARDWVHEGPDGNPKVQILTFNGDSRIDEDTRRSFVKDGKTVDVLITDNWELIKHPPFPHSERSVVLFCSRHFLDFYKEKHFRNAMMEEWQKDPRIKLFDGYDEMLLNARKAAASMEVSPESRPHTRDVPANSPYYTAPKPGEAQANAEFFEKAGIKPFDPATVSIRR